MIQSLNNFRTTPRLRCPAALACMLLISCGLVGCGPEPAPEIDQDVAAQVAAEDEQVADAESEL